MRRLAGMIVAAALAACPAASAAPFEACQRGSELQCAEIPVPLDRTGAVPGTVTLHAERLRSRGARQGALIALNGGPGGASTPYLFEWAGTFFAGWRNRDLVVFDQRGTGLSGALRCPQLIVPPTRT